VQDVSHRVMSIESCREHGLSLDMTPGFKTIMPFDSATVTISNTRGEQQKLGHLRQQRGSFSEHDRPMSGAFVTSNSVERPKSSNDVLYAHGV
jgi:hypothetical protein